MMLAALTLSPRSRGDTNTNNIGSSSSAPAVNNPTSTQDDVEMQSPQNSNLNTAAAHGREASGRSILSNFSTTLSNLRDRERQSDLDAAFRRAGNVSNTTERDIRGFSAGAAGYDPSTVRRNGRNDHQVDLEAQVGSGLGGQEVENQVGVPVAGALTTTTSTAPRVSTKLRKEREENSTLFGPNLANYFSSGASTTGPILLKGNPINSTTNPSSNSNQISAAAPPILNNPIPETPAAIAETPGVGEAGFTFAGYNAIASSNANSNSIPKKVRLGSRGRARGASLSGLSQYGQHQGSESDGHFRGESGMGGEGQDEQEGGVGIPSENITMAEGIEIGTLKKWIEKSAGCGALSTEASAQEEGGDVMGSGNSICSTLQAYVNLKRNTIRLSSMANANNQSTTNGPSSVDPVLPQFDASNSTDVKTGIDHPLSSSPNPISQSTLGSSSATHQLHFEYDCAAPAASIQIFVRASRKHGSWATWQAKQASQSQAGPSNSIEDHEPRGPPPHVLGWPVHYNKLKRGFGKPNKAELTLRLNLYSPPSVTKGDTLKTGNEGESKKEEPEERMIGLQGGTALEEVGTIEPFPTPNPIPEILENQGDVSSQPVIVKEDEDKKGKSSVVERETLKIALVVEALDEDFKPLKEPNLQTTYLRMSSNSFNAEGNRVWSTQVEGQEAEVSRISTSERRIFPFSSPLSPIGLFCGSAKSFSGAALRSTLSRHRN